MTIYLPPLQDVQHGPGRVGLGDLLGAASPGGGQAVGQLDLTNMEKLYHEKFI